MKTFSDLQRQFLNEHHERYCNFTRLLIALSVAFITLLVSLSANITPPSWFAKWSLIVQLASLCFGLVVQHQIMHDPLKHLQEAERLRELAQENEAEAEPTEIRRTPSQLERVCYKLQVFCFVVSFVIITAHFVSAQGSTPQTRLEPISDRSTACLTSLGPRFASDQSYLSDSSLHVTGT